MYNESEKISASEINKYTFCPYQWYYERLYGSKYIRKKYNERNDALNLKDATLSNFTRGINFHNNYRLKRKIISIIKVMILLIIFIIILILLKKV